MNDEDLVKRVVKMIEDLRSLGGSDRLYIFSPYFKPIDISMPTLFGALMNFTNFQDFSEDKVQGFKKIVNDNEDILTGYVRIGNSVYKAEMDHEYKTLPETKGRELIKALVSRAVKVGRFDLSMLNPGWLKNNEAHNTVEADPHHTMQEATWAHDEVPIHDVANEPGEAVQTALKMLTEVFGQCTHNNIQVQEMEEMLEDAVAPYHIELTPSKDGIQIVGQNHVGVMLYNNDGELYWEF
ncbi:MAG: hypothetical protein M0R77_13085 [Gammaproteobacteria bacterium]|nr:hypothetical protein [Gammaproteobacteria bacterium]